MAEVDTIDIPDVTPVTRTVATMSKLIKTAGLPADAANAATDTTSVTHTSILKQISKTIQAAAASAAGLFFVKLSDGTNAVTIKAASSGPPAATDLALVVSIRDVNANIGTNADAIAAAATSVAPVGNFNFGFNGTTWDRLQVDGSKNLKVAATATLAAETSKVIGTVNISAAQPITPVDQYSQYETVAASQTAQAMGATGATGDYLAGVLVFPATAGCGVVTILDNATTIGTFPGGGTTALPSLVPFMIPVGLFSVSGAWKITTGANVAAVGVGKFT